jgi:diguanylate cyclase (GGDEF)-like protein
MLEHPQALSELRTSPPLLPPLRLLILEDVPEDAELIALALEAADTCFSYDVVETEATFQTALRNHRYDAVFSDYRLPNFNGLRAFECLQQSGQDIPFILITGSLGEEAAVECIKRGMTDYVLKDRLFRLPMVLERALQEFELRHQKQAAIAQLHQTIWREAIINRIVQSMRETLVLHEVLQTTVDQLYRALQVNRCLIVQPNRKGVLKVQYDNQSIANTPLNGDFNCPLYQRYESVLLQGCPIGISNLNTIPEQDVQAYAQQQQFRSVAFVPLFYQQVYLGLIVLYQSDRERDWTEDELLLVKAVADHCAIAIHQAQLYQQAQTELAERKRIEAQLRHDAFHDALTNLPNRALFFDRLEHALSLTQRRTARQLHDNYQFAVLFLDLDRFKVINDSLGHVVGDQLLKQVAQRLSSCIRTGDTVARLGGDEFVILLEDIAGIHEAIEVAQRIHQYLRPPIVLDGHEVFVSASIGIALSSTHYSQASQLLRDADTAMYRAKSRGRGCHEVFDAPMHTQAMRRLQLENDLQRAIERHEFWLCYQPIVCLTNRQISGFEALIRWQHPEQGLISPCEFVPIAEETGLIQPIGLWVLQEACQQLRHWQKQIPDTLLTMSVNLSSRQFSQPDLIPKIEQILHEAGLEGRHLKLEITESVLIENSKLAANILQQLRELNIEICIDDFGTGYSSLSYLHRFPITTLKIDRSFVAQIKQSQNSEVVKAIVHLGLNLGMTVVAEGVETAEQFSSLQHSGCHYGQGHWFMQADFLSHSSLSLTQILQQLTTDNHFACCAYGIVPSSTVLYGMAV